jgi:hypothetical protein
MPTAAGENPRTPTMLQLVAVRFSTVAFPDIPPSEYARKGKSSTGFSAKEMRLFQLVPVSKTVDPFMPSIVTCDHDKDDTEYLYTNGRRVEYGELNPAA